ncbi:archease [Melioribacteraceae bacterium 4301-Me]|uniref:archease n=1 Tax=Pyranulibacter aquaticus TaxID=3163344 RepID=UPI003594B15A
MPYKFLDHTADVAFEVESETLEGLFVDSAFALKEVACELSNIGSKSETKIINCNEITLELLLVEFLNQLNFLIFFKKWIFTTIQKLSINKADGEINLSCELIGNKIDAEACNFKVEIKAITFHQMKIEKRKGKYSTKVVLDI